MPRPLQGHYDELGSGHFHRGDGHGGDPFFTADEAHRFVGGCFDPDLLGCDAEGGGDVLFHGFGMGEDFGGFGDDEAPIQPVENGRYPIPKPG